MCVYLHFYILYIYIFNMMLHVVLWLSPDFSCARQWIRIQNPSVSHCHATGPLQVSP